MGRVVWAPEAVDLAHQEVGWDPEVDRAWDPEEDRRSEDVVDRTDFMSEGLTDR